MKEMFGGSEIYRACLDGRFMRLAGNPPESLHLVALLLLLAALSSVQISSYRNGFFVR